MVLIAYWQKHLNVYDQLLSSIRGLKNVEFTSNKSWSRYATLFNYLDNIFNADNYYIFLMVDLHISNGRFAVRNI